MAGRYTNLTLQQLQRGKRYDFVMPDRTVHNNYTFIDTDNTHAIFSEPNTDTTHEDEEDIEWDFSIPLNVAETLRYDVAFESETDKESQASQGGKRKKSRKSKKIRKSKKSRKNKKSIKKRK